MKVLLLLPIIIYLALILVNLDLAKNLQEVNLFGAETLKIPFLLYNSIFIVVYSVLVFFAYDSLNIFLRYKISKQEKEIVDLKSQLYDWQADILKKISKEIENWNKEARKENKEFIKNISLENDDKIKNILSKNNEKLEKFIKKSDERLEDYKNSNKELLVQHWKETDKLLWKMNLIDKGILDKIKDSLKG